MIREGARTTPTIVEELLIPQGLLTERQPESVASNEADVRGRYQ